ncbi:MAG: hypothetical protein GX610_01485 [Rhodococcus sp.]|nr:hypothetical protein [Rhodococcus sp. (in: high G+C Gram-positive bacteria)]
MNRGDAVRSSGILLAAAVLLSGCGTSTTEDAAPAPSVTPSTEVRAADARILGVEEGAECDKDVVSYVPYDFRLKLKAHGKAGDEFSFDFEMKDGSVETVGSASGKNVTFSTGKTTYDVNRIIVHAQGETGIGGSCVITLASAS